MYESTDFENEPKWNDVLNKTLNILNNANIPSKYPNQICDYLSSFRDDESSDIYHDLARFLLTADIVLNKGIDFSRYPYHYYFEITIDEAEDICSHYFDSFRAASSIWANLDAIIENKEKDEYIPYFHINDADIYREILNKMIESGDSDPSNLSNYAENIYFKQKEN